MVVSNIQDGAIHGDSDILGPKEHAGEQQVSVHSCCQHKRAVLQQPWTTQQGLGTLTRGLGSGGPLLPCH